MLDCEFGYLEGWLHRVAEGVNFVIRLNLGSHPPKFWDADGREVGLALSPGEKVCVILFGVWKKSLAEPLWMMSNLEPERAGQIYLSPMKIEETFCDLKGLPGMTRLMNKRQENMEKMPAMLRLVYAIARLLGENLRDRRYGESFPQESGDALPPKMGKKWRLPAREWQAIVKDALASFAAILHPNVPTHV